PPTASAARQIGAMACRIGRHFMVCSGSRQCGLAFAAPRANLQKKSFVASGGEPPTMGCVRPLPVSPWVAVGLSWAGTALAQKKGGVLRIYSRDSPASASIHEEATVSTVIPFAGLFNNLVIYDPHKQQNTMEGIQPELAESWTWNQDKTRLT